MRGTIQVPANSNNRVIEALAKESEIVKKATEGKTIQRAIVVPGKLVNFIVS
jgi:leucyl-tRNA synthetase